MSGNGKKPDSPVEAPASRAVVSQLNVKARTPGERGIPKVPVPEIRVSVAGVEGDFNRWRSEKAGGNPDQALLLIAEETLNELRRESWPVRPGDLGENVTMRGMAEGMMRPGARFRLGEQVEIEISKPCEPCSNLEVLPFVGKAELKSFLTTLRHRRGWYARVLRGGPVATGDRILPV